MQYVYRKYTRERAALAATLITYRPKSAVRDVGKALGLDLAQVERLTGVFAWWDGRRVDPARIREAGFDPENPLIARLVALAGELQGFPRHLSQHVGGFVIARDLLERMVPVENAAMDERTVIQWDKDDLDALGLLKVDCLALGMLSAIQRALAMVSQRRGRKIRMQDIPAEDPEVYAMCQRADTIGVFQIESRAQQSMLPRLKPACFYDLVVESRDRAPGPDSGRHGASVPQAAAGFGARHLSQRRGEGGARTHAGRAHFPGAGDAVGDRRRGVLARRSRPSAPFDGRVAAQRRPREIRAAAGRWHECTGLSGNLCAPDLPADIGLWRIRLPGIALGELCPARLRVGLAEALRACRILRCAAQFAADGLLRARAARAGRAAA
jgi:error-prone DNA polymerase